MKNTNLIGPSFNDDEEYETEYDCFWRELEEADGEDYILSIADRARDMNETIKSIFKL